MNTQTYNTEIEKDADNMLNKLSSFRKRGQLMVFLAGLSWLIAISTFAITSFISALGWWGGDILRTTGWAICILSITATFIIGLIIPLKKLSTLFDVAKHIGKTKPSFASDILSACELAQNKRATPFSAILLSKHFSSANLQLSQINRNKVFSVKWLIGPMIALLVSTGVSLTFASIYPNIFELGLHSIWIKPTIQENTNTTTLNNKVPVVADLTVTLRYPDYLKRPSRKLEAVSGGVGAPTGTTVILEGRSLIANVDKGIIRLSDGESRPLSIKPNGTLVGRFVVMNTTWFALGVGDKNKMSTGPKRFLDIEKDFAPTIRLINPRGSIEVDDTGEVILEFECEDDNGLGYVDLIIRAGLNAEIKKTILRVADNVNHLKNRYHWKPKSLRLDAESKIEIELQVYDNNSINGPQIGKTIPVEVKIMTADGRHKDIIERQGYILDELVDLLALRLNTRPPATPQKEDFAKDRFAVLRSQTEDLLAKIAELIHELNKDSLASPTIKKSFIQIREDLSNQLLHESRLYRPSMANYKKRQSTDRVTIRLVEDANLRVDDLLLEQQYVKLTSNGKNLESKRLLLSKLINKYNSGRTDQSRRAIIDTISRMEKSISKLQYRIENIRGKVSVSQSGNSVNDTIDLTGMLNQIRKLIAEGNIEKAVHLTAQLEHQIASLMAKLESGHLSFKTQRFGEEDKFTNELLEKIMQIETDQLQLRRLTIALQRRYQEKLLSYMKHKIDPLVKKLRVHIKQIREQLDQIKQPVNVKHHMEIMAALKILSRELDLVLGQGDLDQARQLALTIIETIGEIDLNKNKNKSLKLLKKIKHAVQIVIDDISASFPNTGMIFNNRDKRSSKNQSQKQRHLAAQTKKLRTWIKQQKEETRYIASQASDSLNTIIFRMTSSVTNLEEKSLRASLEDQTVALTKLANLRQDLKRGNDGNTIESRPIILKTKISIPQPDEYKVPKEFKQDILEAMHGFLPNHYEEAIKRYYETLVR